MCIPCHTSSFRSVLTCLHTYLLFNSSRTIKQILLCCYSEFHDKTIIMQLLSPVRVYRQWGLLHLCNILQYATDTGMNVRPDRQQSVRANSCTRTCTQAHRHTQTRTHTCTRASAHTHTRIHAHMNICNVSQPMFVDFKKGVELNQENRKNTGNQKESKLMLLAKDSSQHELIQRKGKLFLFFTQ